MAVRRVRRSMRASRGIRPGNANAGLMILVGVCLLIVAAGWLGGIVAERLVIPGLSASAGTENSGSGTRNEDANGGGSGGASADANGANGTNGSGSDFGANGGNGADGVSGANGGANGANDANNANGSNGASGSNGAGGSNAANSGGGANGSNGNAAASEKETVRITLPALDVYAIQLGAYTTQAAAESAAQSCMARSGAGYIIHDGSYRVLAAAYGTSAEAKSVQDQLKSGQNIESYLYTMGTAEATLNITATAATATAIRDSLSAIRALIDEYGALAIALDSGSSDSAAVSRQAAELAERGKAARQPFDSVKRGSEAVDSLVSLFDKFIDHAANAALTNDDAKVARSSQIKYNYIDLLCGYMNYIDALARLKASSAG